MITLPCSRLSPSVKSPNLLYMSAPPSYGNLKSKNTAITKGPPTHNTTKMILRTEFVISDLVSKVKLRTFINAHMQTIENDSFIRTICCDQNSELCNLTLRLAILRLTSDRGLSRINTQPSNGIIRRPSTIVPILFKKKVDWKPKRSKRSFRGSSQLGEAKYLS